MREPYLHRLRVRWGECDAQGVVYFVKYAEYVDLALTELWRDRFRPYGDMIASGADLMVHAMELRFRAPARFDDELEITLDVERVGESSISSAWNIVRARDGEVLCEGTIRHVCVDPAGLGKMRVPDDLRAALA
jgi:acyl-CoA thioester hydrolase